MLTLSYWFDTYPFFFTPIFFWGFLGLFMIAIVFGAICLKIITKGKVNKTSHKVWLKLRSWSFSLGIVGLILVFFKQQRTPYLGMRIWLLVWLIICLIWLIFIVKYLLINVPKIKKEEIEKKEFEKYLPK